MTDHTMSCEPAPALAVIILNYNYARFVAHSIESALSQTVPFDEIIVVNDGSSDSSMEVIGRFADRVAIIDKPNGGQLTATLAGLAASRSDYVYILDADDYASPELSAAIRGVLAGRPTKVQWRLIGVDGEGQPLGSVFPSFPGGYAAAAMRRDNERIGFYICPPTAGNAYRRDYLDRIGLDRLGPHEPLDGPPALAAPYFGEVATIDRPLAFYRVHGSNDSRWDRPDLELLEGEIMWFEARWRQVSAMLGGREPPFGGEAPLYVRERRLMLAALGGGAALGRAALAYVTRLWTTGVRVKHKLLLTAWAFALLGPASLRAPLVFAQRSPVRRPRLFRARVAMKAA
jgi:glycosyltransferase involved in cell wall biosynthesis